jgi:hypothetical protein
MRRHQRLAIRPNEARIVRSGAGKLEFSRATLKFDTLNTK